MYLHHESFTVLCIFHLHHLFLLISVFWPSSLSLSPLCASLSQQINSNDLGLILISSHTIVIISAPRPDCGCYTTCLARCNALNKDSDFRLIYSRSQKADCCFSLWCPKWAEQAHHCTKTRTNVTNWTFWQIFWICIRMQSCCGSVGHMLVQVLNKTCR